MIRPVPAEAPLQERQEPKDLRSHARGDLRRDLRLDPTSLSELVAPYADELVGVRRDLHAHPELGWQEHRTTRQLRDRLLRAGLSPRPLPCGTGLLVDVGRGAPRVALRADIDALPIPDHKTVAYRSTVPGVCHACGHDVHTAALLGAALVLADLDAAGALPAPVRLVFQPAEECMPGGALDVIQGGGLHGIERIFALHCDPRLPVGQVGVRSGPITAAADQIAVRLHGTGGHTARPHLTGDLVHALATVVTGLPSVLSRRVDPRAGMSVVWGQVSAGSVHNAIPEEGLARGTLRCLDPLAWEQAPEQVANAVTALVDPYGIRATVDYERGVPPVVNDADSAELLAAAGRAALGPDAVVSTEQSLGGEDFAWMLQEVSGGLARLGVARPDDPVSRDLHQGTFDVDERSIAVGVRFLVAAALAAAGPDGAGAADTALVDPAR